MRRCGFAILVFNLLTSGLIEMRVAVVGRGGSTTYIGQSLRQGKLCIRHRTGFAMLSFQLVPRQPEVDSESDVEPDSEAVSITRAYTFFSLSVWVCLGLSVFCCMSDQEGVPQVCIDLFTYLIKGQIAD